eukprot:CAMPEP_0177762040 /NCGR_PEP_ID=MMETSP0491_2-20121128/6129_1 /TAXON_ID=63592 /ORGANISM="Tetraselmis chuii, Strain PLY429" /LENGTH=221 /DNA_ID=CAMNT_0019278061 /DNA_START=95 /DNA_END=761 /DNA_ORIENTATION=-
METTAEDLILRHAFIQAVMARGCMPEEEAKQLHRSLTQRSSDRAYQVFLSEVNQKLDFAHFEVRTMSNLFDGSRWVGFVNKVIDDASKSLQNQPSGFTHAQLIFFKSIIDKLALDEDCEAGKASISSTDVQTSGWTFQTWRVRGFAAQGGAGDADAAALRKMSHMEKQETLNALAKQHWLEHHPSQSGCYCIGIRSFMEMRAYLLSLTLPEETRQAWTACM